ncbi:hypothetical protein L2K20_21285 [Mycobacterium sp. MBM]|nr:hypothetical protein [Mycobacterium sp. MBM]
MRFRKSDKSVTPDELTTPADDVDLETSSDPDTALALAEAEAAAAEAAAAAARARAEKISLKIESSAETTEKAADPEAGDTEAPEPDELATGQTESEGTETVAPAAPTPRTGGAHRALRWAAVTVAMLSIGALVTVSVLMVIHHRGVEADQRQAAEYAAAAKQSVVTLMSLDFNSVDEDVQRIIDNSTGDFRKEFEAQAKDFATVAKESKVVTEATATAAAVESMTDNDAVVLVTATSKVTNTSGADQEPRSWRLTVNLTRDGDQIKLSKVEFAP